MNPWMPLILVSVTAGIAAAIAVRGRKAILVGAAVPWFGLLAWLLVSEYLLRYRGGGASMWPIAQAFAGTIAAVLGGGTAALVRLARGAE